MTYYYSANVIPNTGRDQFTSEDIARIPVYPESPELLREYRSNNWRDLRVILNGYTLANCIDEAGARYYLGAMLNTPAAETMYNF